MGNEHVELLRQGLAQATGREDHEIDVLDPEVTEAIFEYFDPGIEFHEDPRFPEAATYRGIEAVRRYWRQFGESFQQFRFRPQEFIDAGENRVVVAFSMTTQGRDSGVTVEAEPGWLFTIEAQRVVRIDAYLDRREAFEAAGLRM